MILAGTGPRKLATAAARSRASVAGSAGRSHFGTAVESFISNAHSLRAASNGMLRDAT